MTRQMSWGKAKKSVICAQCSAFKHLFPEVPINAGCFRTDGLINGNPTLAQAQYLEIFEARFPVLFNTTTLFFCGNNVDCMRSRSGFRTLRAATGCRASICMQRMQGMNKRAHVSHTPQSDWKTITYTPLLRFF